jgi:beta-lactamase class A
MPIHRRDFQRQLAAVLAAGFAGTGCAGSPSPAAGTSDWAALERSTGGRLGVAVLQADGQLDGHRLDERFPLCSTFKWLAAAPPASAPRPAPPGGRWPGRR